MLSRANLLGKVRPADETKCFRSNTRSRVVKNHTQSKASNQCHGSDSSRTKLVQVCTSPSTITDSNSVREHEQPISRSRQAHPSEPHCKALTVRKGRSVRNGPGISAAGDIKDQLELAASKPGRRVLQPSGYGEKGKVQQSFLCRSTELASTDRPQKRAAGHDHDQTRKDLNLIEEVEACFSNSLSMQLVSDCDPQLVEQAYLSGAQADFEVPGVCTSLPPMDRLDSGVLNVDTSNETASARQIKKGERGIGGLLLLNGLAAIYGSSNVANKYVAEVAPALPGSLASVVKFTSALTVFIPALVSVMRNREVDLLRAGAELGSIAFAASFLDSCNPAPGGSSSSTPSLLFAFTVVFVPLMELFCGHQPGLKLARVATLGAAILGMGLLEEEGLGWTGVSCPQISDLWGLAVSAILALHIFRSEALGTKFDPLKLNAVQCGVLAILSLGWEVWSSLSDASATSTMHLFSSSGCSFDSLQCVPWVPLIYSGLVCSGLCSWLELRSLQSIHASTATLVYTTIPLWGAFLSSFMNGGTAEFSTDLAFTCGLAIAASCSLYAHFILKGDEEGQDFEVLESATISIEKKAAFRVESSITAKSTCTDVCKSLNSEASGCDSDSELTGKDYFPAGLLVSQLKFPYYAAQAKGLLAEIKFKLGALKSLGLVFTGISTTTSSIVPAGISPPSALAGGSTSTTTALASSSSSAATWGSGTNNLTASPIGEVASHSHKVDIFLSMNSLNVHIEHGMDLASIPAAQGTWNAHTLVHLTTAISSGMESTLVAVTSDLVMAVEEAESVATLLEKLLLDGVEKAVHLVTGCLTAGSSILLQHKSDLSGPDPTNQMANFVGTASDSQLPVQVDELHLLIDPSHLVDALVKGFCNLSEHLLSLTTM